MAPPRITLYLDTVSPFAYMAYYILRNDAVFRKCEVTYVPILLGGLMNMCNNTPPLHIKNKDKWIDMERRRWAALFDIPMHTDSPPGFPPKTLPIMRALAAIQHTEAASSSSSSSSHQQPQLTAALDALWHEFFVLHTQTHEPAHLSRILSSSASSLDAEAILQAATTDQVKKRLTQNTNEAFASGAFGLPWMVCTNEAGETETFWGVDHMGQVAAFLGLEKPGSGGWKAML
jgi:2-hydroxychromene-2-carboxylate isomerase